MKMVPLGDVATFVRGVTFKPSDRSDDGVGIMRTKNVQENLDLSDIVRVPARFVKRDEQFLQPGDTLVSSANSWHLVGRACWVPEFDERLAIGGFVSGLRATSAGLDRRYLYRWFTAPATQRAVRSLSNQTTNISNLSLKRAANLAVPLPSLDEQRRIVAILDHADAVRATRRQMLAHLDDLTQSIYQDMFGGHENEQVRLGDVAVVSSGITKGRRTDEPTRSTPYLAVSNVQAGHLKLDVVKEIPATAAEVERYALRDGDLVLTEGGDPDKLGRGTVWRSQLPLCLHQNHIFRVRPDEDRVLPDYLSACLAGQGARSYFLRSAKQTTGIASINMTQLRAAPVSVPPLAEQRRFLDAAGSVTANRAAVQRALASDDELFASLQSRAFRGDL